MLINAVPWRALLGNAVTVIIDIFGLAGGSAVDNGSSMVPFVTGGRLRLWLRL